MSQYPDWAVGAAYGSLHRSQMIENKKGRNMVATAESIKAVCQTECRCEVRIPNRFQETHRVVDDCASSARAWGLSESELPGLRLALHEAVVNAMRHGNRHDKRKHVRVASFVSATTVLVEVEDQGAGFDVDGIEDPTDDANLNREGGRGVFLMRHFMDQVRFNEHGNCVTLIKTLATPN